MGAYIKENWLFVVVAVYLVSMVLYGHYRGFIRLAVSAVSLVLSLGVVHFGAPSVANLLRSNEVVYQAVEDSVTKFIQKDDEAENEAADAAPPSVQRSIIEEMELPEQLKDALLENNNSEVYEALGVSSFTHYVSRYLANSLINIISFFLLFAAVSDKNYESMLETLMRKLKPDRLVLTHLYTSRALPMEAMEKAAHRVADGCEVQSIPDVKTAYQTLVQEKRPEDTCFCVGSLYLIGELEKKISRTGFDSTARMV